MMLLLIVDVGVRVTTSEWTCQQLAGAAHLSRATGTGTGTGAHAACVMQRLFSYTTVTGTDDPSGNNDNG